MTGGGAGAGGSGGSGTIPGCTSDTFNGHSYWFCGTMVTWTAARDSCESAGMHLAWVDDDAENQWLGNNAPLSAGVEGMWLGASDAATEDEWRWQDGTLFWLGDETGAAQGGLYNAWFAGSQPEERRQGTFDCATLDLGSGATFGWYSQACTGGIAVYACESP